MFASAFRTVPLAAALAVALTAAPASASDRAGGEAATSIRLLSERLQVDADRRVAIRVRCSTRAACTGTVRVRVGNGTDRHPERYRVGGRRTATILVGLTPTAFRKIVGTKTLATVTFTESGDRTLERRLPIRGRAPRA